MSSHLNEKLAFDFTQAEFLDIKRKPLDIFPSVLRPYLELIRLEKAFGGAGTTVTNAWLGFAMNFGLMTAWVSTTNTFDTPILVTAMAACWCWTMLYDTIYACQDIEDDVKMGIRSTAILFGSYIRPLLIACGCSFIVLLCGAGILNGQGPAFYTLSVGGLLLHLIRQWWTVDLEIPKSCWGKDVAMVFPHIIDCNIPIANFNSNGQLGWIIWLGLVIDYAINLRLIQVNLWA
ncbi:hypothetical protein HHX47_DHR5001046 [Lentinula edodes]|nr:hypothetical protein HHX47_DHR5001046 [Lentinula edodes]